MAAKCCTATSGAQEGRYSPLSLRVFSWEPCVIVPTHRLARTWLLSKQGGRCRLPSPVSIIVPFQRPSGGPGEARVNPSPKQPKTVQHAPASSDGQDGVSGSRIVLRRPAGSGQHLRRQWRGGSVAW